MYLVSSLKTNNKVTRKRALISVLSVDPHGVPAAGGGGQGPTSFVAWIMEITGYTLG